MAQLRTAENNAHDAQYPFPAGNSLAPLSLSAVFTATTQDTARLNCQTPANGNALQMRLTAVPVTLAN
jgi:hypothetical protein